jgi:hypothetical protein
VAIGRPRLRYLPSGVSLQFARDGFGEAAFGFAALIRLREDGSGSKVIERPLWVAPVLRKGLAYGRKTYNARTATVGKLPSFKVSWANSRRRIILTRVGL